MKLPYIAPVVTGTGKLRKPPPWLKHPAVSLVPSTCPRCRRGLPCHVTLHTRRIPA